MVAPTYKPHVVLMDIRLPGIDGFEAARSIKEDLPAAAIVMVTGVEEPGWREEALRVGAAGFVTKDQLIRQLPPLLSQLLGRSGTEAQKDVSEDPGPGR